MYGKSFYFYDAEFPGFSNILITLECMEIFVHIFFYAASSFIAQVIVAARIGLCQSVFNIILFVYIMSNNFQAIYDRFWASITP